MILRVLIVDDERLILMGLKACIEKIKDVDCRVRTAISGKQAFEMLEIEPADLMITDVEMDGSTGLDLIEKVKQKGFCHHFMVLSGYDKFEYAQTALRLGVEDYLLKPVDKDILRKNISRIAKSMGKADELELIKPYGVYFPHLSGDTIPPSLKKSVDFIADHYQDTISLSMLSEFTGKSENYLCSLFKKEWDVTFLEVVNEMRLREALYMLLYEPSVPVHNIAGKVGYRTERQLFRLIKGKLGVTPQQIRQGHTIDISQEP